MKRLLTLVLAVCVLFSFAAFADEEDWFGRFEEPVTIRVCTDKADNDDPSGWTWENNEWTQAWSELFNINIELMWNTATAEDYNTRFALAIASRDLPDLLQLDSRQFTELQRAGKLADLTDYYEDNIYPYLKEYVIEAQPQFVLDAAFVDGVRYAIPISNLQTNSRSVLIRRDYREAIGADLPTTVEELIDLGKAFVDEGLAKYALLLQQNVFGDGYSDIQAVANGFGAYPECWITDENGDLVYSPTTENMHVTLDVYRDLYRDGYIQPTFATEIGDNVTAYITNGEIGILPVDFWVLTWPLPLTDADGNIIEWDVLPVLPSETNDNFMIQGTGSAAGITYICVNADCEHPEAVLRLFNHTCAMNTDPDRAQTDKFHSYVVAETGETVQVHMHNPAVKYWAVPNVNTLTGWAVDEALKGNLEHLAEQPHYQQQYDNVMGYLAAEQAGDIDGMKSHWSMYKLFGGEGSVFLNFYQTAEADGYLYNALDHQTENYNRLWGTLKQYENTFYVNYICETEETTFEEFVAEWYAMGGELLTEELNADR